MELNKRAEMNEVPLLAIGRQSYDMVSPENEHQSGTSAWSAMDFNGDSPSTMNDVWNTDWMPYTGDLPHTHSLQAHHRAKRQHCWGTASLTSEQQQGGGPSSSDNESVKSFHAELFGCRETSNAGSPGFDFFQATSNSASISSAHGPPHNLTLVNNLRQPIEANGIGHSNASAPQDIGMGSFFADSGWKNNGDSVSSESAEITKGKCVDHFDSTAARNSIELLGCQEPFCFPSVLVPQKENGKEKFDNSADYLPKQRTEEIRADLRSACKRKLSPVDLAEVSAVESQVTTANESAASRLGGFGTSSGHFGFTNFHPISSTSTTTQWGDSCNNPSPDYSCHEAHPSRGLIERTSGLFGSGEDAVRSLFNQPLNIPNDLQSHSQSLFARNFRRSVHVQPFSRRNLQSESSNIGSSPSLLQNSDQRAALGGETSPRLPPISNWGPCGSRRINSAFSVPASRGRNGAQGALEGSRFRSMQGRALDWAVAAAAATVPSTTTSEPRATSQLFPTGGVAVPTGGEVELPESSARISHAATSFFNSGVLASHLPASGSDMPRVTMEPPQPVSIAPSHQVLAGPPLEAYVSVPGQPAGRSALLPPSHGHRDALFSAPAQSLLGLPFRGLHTLRADGDYRRQFLSEILNAMHYAFRGEDLNFEEFVMLDPSVIYGDAHDQHRDMRLDVDNMTYEELLALEERIGNVSTGLNEEKIFLCLRESKYSSLDATVAAISQESDVKCSVCQEEFAEDDELGRLDCGHGYHSACIKQWLLQKNECPICKSSAYVKP